MLYSGNLAYKDNRYTVNIVEGLSTNRVDVFYGDSMAMVEPIPSTVAVSVVEDKTTRAKYVYGDIDLYYIVERVQRAARIHRFESSEREEEDLFENGLVIYECRQKSDRFEYNFRTENRVKVKSEMRTPEAQLYLGMLNEQFELAMRHSTLKYEQLTIDAPEFNEDSAIVSRMATMSELREKFDLSWMKNKDYRWCNTLDELRGYVDEAMAKPYLKAVDTETRGLDVYHFPDNTVEQDGIVCIVFTWKKDFAVLVPLAFKYEENLPFDEALEIMKPVIESGNNLTQNGFFDYKVFLALMMELKIKEDTLLQMYTLEPNPKKGSKSLKNAIMKYFGIKQLGLTDLFPPTKEGKTEIRFDLLTKELALFYACPDVDLLLSLYERLKEEIAMETAGLMYRTEVSLVPILAEAEWEGLRVDMDRFHLEMRLCSEVIEKLEKVFYEIAGYKMNLDSPDQVGKFLYEKLGCEKIVVSKSDPNKGSTSAKALEYLSDLKKEVPELIFRKDISQKVLDEKGNPVIDPDSGQPMPDREIIKRSDLNKAKYPAVLILKKYRDYRKLLTSFFNPIAEKNRGGFLFNWISQTGAATGRIISPFQTLPEYIKELILPDSDEHGMLVVDFKQIELRIMFGLAKETAMIEAAENPDNDIHRVAAGNIYDLELWQINSKMRKEAKALDFGIPYDLGNYRLAGNLYGLPVTDEKIQKAMDARARFYKAMPRVERMFIRIKEEIALRGCFFTVFGRGHYYENILVETDKAKRARILRQGNNVPIQGFCADFYKLRIVELEKQFRLRGWNKRIPITYKNGTTRNCRLVRMAQFVHDEIVMPYHKKSIHVAQILYVVKNVLQVKMEGYPTFYIGAAVADNWGEGKKDKFEMPVRLLQQICDEVEAGMHTVPIDNPKKWMLDRIAHFKETEFKNYFDELGKSLTAKGIPVTASNIAKHFRHNVLTHDVMAMYKIPADYHTTLGRNPTHEDEIEYAVLTYIDKFGIEFEKVSDLDMTKTADTHSNANNLLSLLSNDKAEQIRKKNNALLSLLPKTGTSDSSPRSSAEAYAIAADIVDDDYFDSSDEKQEWVGLTNSFDDFGNPFDVQSNRDFFENDYEIDIVDEGRYAALTGGFVSKDELDTHDELVNHGMSTRVLTLSRRKIINLELVSMPAIEIIKTILESSHRDDGIYEVWYRMSGKHTQTRYNVDKLDESLIDLILAKSETELQSMFDKIV